MIQPSFDDVTTKERGPELHKNQTKSFKQNSKKFFEPQQKCRTEIPLKIVYGTNLSAKSLRL